MNDMIPSSCIFAILLLTSRVVAVSLDANEVNDIGSDMSGDVSSRAKLKYESLSYDKNEEKHFTEPTGAPVEILESGSPSEATNLVDWNKNANSKIREVESVSLNAGIVIANTSSLSSGDKSSNLSISLPYSKTDEQGNSSDAHATSLSSNHSSSLPMSVMSSSSDSSISEQPHDNDKKNESRLIQSSHSGNESDSIASLNSTTTTTTTAAPTTTQPSSSPSPPEYKEEDYGVAVTIFFAFCLTFAILFVMAFRVCRRTPLDYFYTRQGWTRLASTSIEATGGGSVGAFSGGADHFSSSEMHTMTHPIESSDKNKVLLVSQSEDRTASTFSFGVEAKSEILSRDPNQLDSRNEHTQVPHVAIDPKIQKETLEDWGWSEEDD